MTAAGDTAVDWTRERWVQAGEWRVRWREAGEKERLWIVSPYFVPDTKRISELLGELRSRNVHLAIVLDQSGSMRGSRLANAKADAQVCCVDPALE